MAVFLKSIIHNKDITKDQSRFINNKSLQWDYFIQSLQDGAASAVRAFLGGLHLDCDDFHFGKVLQLYNFKNRSFIKTSKRIDELEGMGNQLVVKFYKARRDLHKYLGKPASLPVPCEGLGCPNCTFTLAELRECEHVQETAKDQFWQTCLHPVQELFLWSLLCSNSEVTIALWEYTKDRMASALIACAVYSGIAKRGKKIKRMDTCTQLKDDSRLFKMLAIDTLTSSASLAEQTTHILLKKPCPWWSPPPACGGPDKQACCLNWWSCSQPWALTVLDVALKTKCKAFLAEGMCDQIMSQRWIEKPSDRNLPKLRNESEEWGDVDEEPPRTCTCCTRSWTHPLAYYLCSIKARFVVCILLQLVFLLLYSYVLLKGLTGTFDPYNIALIIWVGDILVEEIRQLLSVETKVKKWPTVFCSPSKKSMSACKKRFKAYFGQGWNVLDTISIGLFILGTVLAFCRTNRHVHDAGRHLLAVDIVVFILRFLQVLVVFKELGLWLVMAKKMVLDTVWFMMILLSIAYGYAVASESLLHEENVLPDLYEVPKKAFFSMFGEFFLNEIEQDASHGKWVPIYLGVFVVMTNVLLLNLLIARLSSRYTKMETKAIQYRTWHMCQVILEYQHRSCFPPPFNILAAVFTVLGVLLTWPAYCIFGRKLRSAARRTCNSCQRELTTDYCGCLGVENTAPGEAGQQGLPLTPLDGGKTGIQVEYQVHGTCLRVWNQGSSDNTDILVITKTAMNLTLKNKFYKLRKERNLLIWKADPTEVREINLRESVVEFNYPEHQDIYVQYSQLDKFEKEQAEWAISQIGNGDNTHQGTVTS